MNDYNSNSEAVEQFVRGATETNTTHLVKAIAVIAIGLVLFLSSMYWGWTTRGALENEAIDGAISLPLRYSKTLVAFESLGYKIELVRIPKDGNKENNVGELINSIQIKEQELIALRDSNFLKVRAAQQEKQQIIAFEELRREAKNQELMKKIETRLEISAEDSKGLSAIILGEEKD